MNQKKMLGRLFIHLILIVLSIMFVFPFFWLLRSSFMNSGEIFAMPMHWLPKEPVFTNFGQSLTTFPFFLYLRNTLLIVALNMVGNVFSSSFSAFGFARLRFPGRNIIFALVISTMMIPSSAIMIPQFIIWFKLGLYDTYVPLILPSFFINAFFIFLIRQFISTIPSDYDEAALMDGAGYPTIYARIVLPLIKPALATVGVFSFMWTWNDFMGPLIYLKTSNKYTLALGLQVFLDRYINQWNLLMAASTVVIIPMIILYFFAQRYFIEGITFSGIKG